MELNAAFTQLNWIWIARGCGHVHRRMVFIVNFGTSVTNLGGSNSLFRQPVLCGEQSNQKKIAKYL